MHQPDDDPSDGSKVLVFVVGGIALLVVAAASFLMLTGGSPEVADDVVPDQLAVADAADEPVTLTNDYCNSPGPLEGFAGPTVDGPNATRVYTRPDALGFNLDSDALPADLTNLWSAVDDPVYVACIDSQAGDESRTCRGYQGGLVHKLVSKSYSYRLYELATGTLVEEGPTASEPMTCPGAAVSGVDTIQAVSAWDLGMRLSAEIVPGGTSNLHFGEALNYNDAAWCANPTDVTYAATDVSDPRVWLLGGWDWTEMTDVVTSVPAEVSHIACITLSLSGESETCRFENGERYEVGYDSYSVVVIDLLTGESVATEAFDGGVGCRSILIGEPPRGVQDPSIPGSAYDFVRTSIGAEIVEDTDESEGG